LDQLDRPNLSVNDSGHLTIGGLDTVDLADAYGTPLYVVDAQRIRSKYRALKDALSSEYPDTLICYSYKANSNLAICKILQEEGSGATVASHEGIYVARNAGVASELIALDGPSKSKRDLHSAIKERIGMINAESIEELQVIEGICVELELKANVGVRLNLGLEAPTHRKLATSLSTHKFGMSEEDALQAFCEAKLLPHLNLFGIHSHVGSQILDSPFFKLVAEKLLNFAEVVKAKSGIEVKYVNFGGGIGIPYGKKDRAISAVEYARAVCGTAARMIKDIGFQPPKLVFEPGRFIVGDSTILLTRLNYAKKLGSRRWLLVDAGMNDFIRPALYGSYHRMVLANKMNRSSEEVYNVGGPICESSDVFAEDIPLPKAERKDLISILDVGAYGLSMASHYNIRPIAAMVLIEDGRARIVRRREATEDLVAYDVG